MLETVLFLFFAAVAIVSAISMLVSNSPIISALWLILNFFCLACLYLTLHAQFIAIIQILVYAGAIMVLFLFVIMLLNLDAVAALDKLDWRKVIAFGLGIVVLLQLVYVFAVGLGAVPAMPDPETAALLGSAETIGFELFSRYAFLIQIIAVLLLAATIGAVLLAKRRFV